MTTYSFLDVNVTITGPGGAVAVATGANQTASLGPGSGNAEEGITVEMTEDKDTMTWGADGTLMHSLHAAVAGRMIVRLLKTSPTNQSLSVMYNIQATSSAVWGYNTITISDLARGDTITGQQMAFMKFPNVVYAKEGGVMEWTFGGVVHQQLGSGVLINP
jgi:hypothetical protein